MQLGEVVRTGMQNNYIRADIFDEGDDIPQIIDTVNVIGAYTRRERDGPVPGCRKDATHGSNARCLRRCREHVVVDSDRGAAEQTSVLRKLRQNPNLFRKKQ